MSRREMVMDELIDCQDRIKELEKELSQAYENAAEIADEAAWNRSDTRWERRLCQGVAERIRELKPDRQDEAVEVHETEDDLNDKELAEALGFDSEGIPNE